MAVGHKILELIYTLLTKKEHYIDPIIDYEALMAKRNAPRWIRMLNLLGVVFPVACDVTDGYSL
ncbi:MAG: hypothetical protein HQK97_07410 [Nitrospirae bacterium]|nr:hypothetical protein [Nitrospirota bacterium]